MQLCWQISMISQLQQFQKLAVFQPLISQGWLIKTRRVGILLHQYWVNIWLAYLWFLGFKRLFPLVTKNQGQIIKAPEMIKASKLAVFTRGGCWILNNTFSVAIEKIYFLFFILFMCYITLVYFITSITLLDF